MSHYTVLAGMLLKLNAGTKLSEEEVSTLTHMNTDCKKPEKSTPAKSRKQFVGKELSSLNLPHGTKMRCRHGDLYEMTWDAHKHTIEYEGKSFTVPNHFLKEIEFPANGWAVIKVNVANKWLSLNQVFTSLPKV